MSRSTKHPMIRISKKYSDNIHSRVRSRIKRLLVVSNDEESDNINLDADARGLGLEDMGTKFGFNVDTLLSEEDEELRKKFSRK